MRRLGLVASALTVGIGIVYWGTLSRQAGPDGLLAELHPNTVMVSVAIAVLAALTAYGALAANPQRRALALWVAIPGFAVLGYLAMFSIGLLFWVAGLVTLLGAVPALRGGDVRSGPVLAWAAALSVAWVGAGALLIWLSGETF